MNKFNSTVVVTAISLAFSAAAIAQGMSKGDYKAGKDTVSTEYKSAKAACSAQSGNAKDICMAQAKGKEKVAKAELEARYKPSNKADYAVSVAKAEANYAVDREKCDDMAGNEKKACVKQVKAAKALAKTEAQATMRAGNTNQPATQPSSPPTARQEKPGAYVDDTVITAKVKAAVLKEPSLKSSEINVETNKGVVQLTGFVSSRADINRAVEVAGAVKGVTSVKNDMIVKGKQ